MAFVSSGALRGFRSTSMAMSPSSWCSAQWSLGRSSTFLVGSGRSTLKGRKPFADRSLFGFSNSNTKMVVEGEKAPDFTLPNQVGEDVTLSSFLGKRAVVLFFYPKDDTPGCTKEACMFRDASEDFSELNAEVIGVSSDSSHTAFIQKHSLNFTLLSDTDGKVRSLFGVPKALFVLPGRVTYVIDKDGVVVKVFNSMTDFKGHVDESLRALKVLRSNNKL